VLEKKGERKRGGRRKGRPKGYIRKGDINTGVLVHMKGANLIDVLQFTVVRLNPCIHQGRQRGWHPTVHLGRRQGWCICLSPDMKTISLGVYL
jgi:hypothetical protein